MMVDNLVAYLKKCDDAYYNTDQVLVSNDTYDAMVETLKKIAPEHEYLRKVGSSLREGTNKLGRIVPMGTLSKYHKDDEVVEWLSKESCDVIFAPKYDGFGIELTYKDGFLVMASTRGNGYVGEDVLEAVLRISNVPIQLPDKFKSLERVRGEAIIPRRYHDSVKELGYNAMRNAVPGIVRSNRKDALGYVEFLAYEFFDDCNDRVEQRMKYSSIFNVEDYRVFLSGDFKGIQEYRSSYKDRKETYDYEIDGVVLKTVLIKEDDLLCPNHQIAWKWESKIKETILRDIEFNVGVTGNISVVGIFDEVEFQGATLKRASIGSLQRYEEMKPAIGDIIGVSRRGDIIPYIEFVITECGDDYQPLEVCPCCGTEILDYRCKNPYCHDKVKLRIKNYISSVGLKGIGNSLVSALVDRDIIRSVSDIYKMDANEIMNIPRQGSSSVEKWKSLQNKELSALEFFNAYPFDNVGKNTWKLILERYSVPEILSLTNGDFEKNPIKGIGYSKYSVITQQLSEDSEDISNLLSILKLV